MSKPYMLKLLDPTDYKSLCDRVLRLLSGIDPDNLTTSELMVIRLLASNPPKSGGSAELRMK